MNSCLQIINVVNPAWWKILTVCAFSMLNFRRSRDEIADL
jgi:undecaprenyl pyrophosphate synthase